MKKVLFSFVLLTSIFANAGVYTLDSQILQVIMDEAQSIKVLDETGALAPSNKQLPARFARAIRNSDLSNDPELATGLDGVTFSCEERDSIGDNLVYGCALDFSEGSAEETTMYYIEVLITPEHNISVLTEEIIPESGD